VQQRRARDARPVAIAIVAASPSSEAGSFPHGPEADQEPKSTGTPRVVLVLQGPPQAVHVDTGDYGHDRLPEGLTLEETLAIEAAAAARRWQAAFHRHDFNERFVVFVERLNRARRASEVRDAILQDVPDLMRVHSAVLLRRRILEAGRVSLIPVTDDRIEVRLQSLDGTVLRRPGAFRITADDTLPDRPFAGLAPLFTQLGAADVRVCTIGSTALLAIVDRRTGIPFTGEDWFRLRTVARHAAATFERLRQRPGREGR
jgi:hypothetical protein